ncbi:hypothetical protein [Polaromonas sp.]|uniref:hypothetical protein n=1 Tax=Polaromonas sp. TaxID=1869339 RepID=UPI002731A104|nr:hypothetical protein [Polaromonas sp.]MDP1740974.1 hypothetical protein [Polaromonas sp.]
MATARLSSNQITFRLRASDSPSGVSRETLKRLAKLLGVNETQVIHFALRELAVKHLPQYEADEGPAPGRQQRTLADRLKLFDPERHGGEAMVSGRVGIERF